MTHRAFAEQFIPSLTQIEGGYSNDPDDPGGETNHGITKAVARAFGWQGEMRDLGHERAVLIYKERYWDMIKADDICKHSVPIALEMADSAVNIGQTWPVKWLQGWLNAMNYNDRIYPDVGVDGVMGPMTLQALADYMNVRQDQGEQIMLNALNADQAVYYKSLGKEKFIYGWMAKRVKIS